MINVTGSDMADTLLRMYSKVAFGHEITARGQKCKNIRNLGVEMDASVPPLTSFSARNLNLDYAKREWLWYLTGDKFDDSIMEHAKMWQKLKQPDGSFFSNYGQYIFGVGGPDGESQFDYVLRTLQQDENSRRASMVLLQRDHLFHANVDTVCTYSINFCIEDGRLHMTVMMRSNDVIFGFTNDAFCFWNLYQFMFALLQLDYPNLREGSYTHIVNSMHVYERHYAMILDILKQGMTGYYHVDVPKPTTSEVLQLIASGGRHGDGTYSAWLKA